MNTSSIVLADVLTSPLATVLSALIAAFAGSLIGHALTKRREDQASRRRVTIQHIERQLEELYGPLAGLVRQSRTLYEVACQILPTSDDSHAHVDTSRFRDKDGEKWRFFIETYWFPINRDIVALMRSKVHLLEREPTDSALPESCKKFLRHATEFESLHRLWKEHQISSQVTGQRWPAEFGEYVDRTLLSLTKRYDSYRTEERKAFDVHSVAEPDVSPMAPKIQNS